MATWNEDRPAVSNDISADIPDIKENLEFLALWAKERRSVFTYNGGTTAYTVKCKSAFYYCKDKVCWWDAELTTGAIGTPGASDWYYLYLDHSEITSGTEITASEFTWSNTEPAWNTTYAGWYNGDDKCIFAVLTNSAPDNILEFNHQDNFVLHETYHQERSIADLDTAWEDVDCATSVPKFATKINVLATLEVKTSDASVTAYWRPNGHAGAGFFLVGLTRIGTDQRIYVNPDVITDTSQIFEVKMSRAGTDQLDIQVNGWYLPIGL